MCEIGHPDWAERDRLSVRPDNEAQQPSGRRLATHFGTTLVIFKAVILHFGGLPDIRI